MYLPGLIWHEKSSPERREVIMRAQRVKIEVKKEEHRRFGPEGGEGKEWEREKEKEFVEDSHGE